MHNNNIIAIAAPGADSDDCGGTEVFALMVLGDSMLPEFAEGEIIIIEPAGHTRDGSYVLVSLDGEWLLRQLYLASSGWRLRALNSAYAEVAIDDLASIRGVIIQKTQPGRRRALKHYVD